MNGSQPGIPSVWDPSSRIRAGAHIYISSRRKESVSRSEQVHILPLQGAETESQMATSSITAGRIHVSTHPLISRKMTLLRDKNTSSVDFRRILREITFYLGYEASRTLTTSVQEVTTPNNVVHKGVTLVDSVAIIPILRAGLGMSDAMVELMPKSSVHHIGMFRSKGSLLPTQYYNRLPKDEPCDIAYIVDPCIATSNTIQAVCSIVKRWGAKKVIVIAAIGAKAGVDKLLEVHPDVEVYIGEIDDVLSADGMILPGIGDAGDRLFATPGDEIDMDTSSRKRKTTE